MNKPITIKIIKRTFEASKYPKGSKKRDELNEEGLTSEYLPSYKYVIEFGERYQIKLCKTKKEAEDYIK